MLGIPIEYNVTTDEIRIHSQGGLGEVFLPLSFTDLH